MPLCGTGTMSSTLLRTIQNDVAELVEVMHKACQESVYRKSFEDHTIWSELVEYNDSASEVYISSPTVNDRRLQPFVAPCMLLRVLYNSGQEASSAGCEFPFQFDTIATNGLQSAANHVCARLSEVLVSTGVCTLGQVGSLVRSGTAMYNYVRLYQLCEELRDLRHSGMYRWHAAEELYTCCANVPGYSDHLRGLSHAIARNMLLSNALKCKLNSAQMLAVRACVPDVAVEVDSVFGMGATSSDPSDLLEALDTQLKQLLDNAPAAVSKEAPVQEALDVACRLLGCPTIRATAR